MNACPAWKDHLLDAALGGPPSRELENHLRSCAHCSAALTELRSRCEQMDMGLRQLVRETEPSPAFRPRWLASLEARPIRAVWSPGWPAVLAVGLVAATLAWLMPRWSDRPQPALVPALDGPLSQWRSPTAALLHFPGEELLESNLRLGKFYFPIKGTPEAKAEGRKPRKP